MDHGRYPNKLKMIRRRNGYSRKKVARFLGYSDTSMLSHFENGRSLPSLLQTMKLSRLFHVLPHELFDELWGEYQQFEHLSFTENQ